MSEAFRSAIGDMAMSKVTDAERVEAMGERINRLKCHIDDAEDRCEKLAAMVREIIPMLPLAASVRDRACALLATPDPRNPFASAEIDRAR